jgi:tellurite resistance protein TerC
LIEALLQAAPLWAWIGFIVLVGFMLAIDLGVFNRKIHAPSSMEAAVWSCVWIAIALLFNAAVWKFMGAYKGVEWFTAYVLEKSLSVDNLFVFVLVFQSFAVDARHQHRILYWGVLGAIVFRAIMIVGGAALLNHFEWMIYLFGAFLIWTGIKMFVAKKEEETSLSDGAIVRIFKKIIPFDPEGGHQHFFTKKNGKWLAAPMLLVLLVVEFTDILFAVDSIPAVLAITRDLFVVFTSNIFAILGLRSLYFILANMINRFHYLKAGLAIILTFVGLKMCLAHQIKVRFRVNENTFIIASLIFISVVLLVSIVFSLFSTKHIGKKI